ncbi:Phthiocerol/phenolphthiocerol synthesis polyketide synthase type I PpsC [compost metagenome]
MKAIRIVPGAAGGTLAIQDIPTPVAGPGQVLVRVMASGLNRGEINLVRNARSGNATTAGIEFAGVVAGVGAGVQNVREGDRVMGHGGGGQAEYVVADARAIMPVPPALSWVEAAAFPNVFITAHDALVTNGEFRASEAVLVNAASSGIGLAAIQIAAQMGAGKVLATSRSADKVARLKAFGVNCAIDLSRQDQREAVTEATDGRGVDVIVDSVGGTVFEPNLKSLAVKGRLVNLGRMGSSSAQIDLTEVWLKRLKLVGVTFRTRTEEERLGCIEACARDVLPLLAAGRIQLPVDRVYRMEDVARSHAYMETNQHFGKIVLAIDGEVQREFATGAAAATAA